MQIDYIIKKLPRHSMSIHIDSEKRIIVKVPLGTPTSVAEEFMQEKKQWILRQLQKVEQQNILADQMGTISDQELKEIKKKARILIPQRVEYYAKRSGITYNRIFIRLQKSRWGSCSAEGNLNFNCLLVLMPLEILDSVVVHELCHRRHMDHSREFYNDVCTIFPDYKKCDKWLKQNGGAFFKRLEKTPR